MGIVCIKFINSVLSARIECFIFTPPFLALILKELQCKVIFGLKKKIGGET